MSRSVEKLVHDAETELPELGELAAKKRRFLWALFGNVLLLVIMLGGPFLRGILRAHALWRGFGRFSACVYGGEPIEGGGLGVPIGSEAHFAAQLLSRAPDWPERCQAALRAFVPDAPIFILPSVKRAENDVRTAAKVVERELGAVLVRVPGERLSTRPLRAIEQLRAVLSRHALTAGVFSVPEADAFKLDPKRGLPIPTRVPIYAASDARLSLWGGDSELHALALDSTGVSYVNVAGGSMTQTRLTRPKLLEAFVPSAEGGHFVWAMSGKRCREREEGCAKKALGVAPLILPLSEVPPPRWFGAHPWGRIDRSMWFQGDRMGVVAEASDKRMQPRLFNLPLEAPDKSQSELPPLAASETFESQPRADALWGALSGEPTLLFASAGETATELKHYARDGIRILAELPGGTSAWLSGRSCSGYLAVVFGSERALRVGRMTGEGAFSAFAEVPLGLMDVVHDRDESLDRVRSVCTDDGSALVFARDSKDVLRAIVCRQDEGCSLSALATGVQAFALEAHDGAVLVAYAGAKNVAQIRLVTLDMRAQVLTPERVPAACWAPRGGLCGTPVLQRVGQRVLLGAREGTDLMLLESPDEGASWEPLRGLKRFH